MTRHTHTYPMKKNIPMIIQRNRIENPTFLMVKSCDISIFPSIFHRFPTFPTFSLGFSQISRCFHFSRIFLCFPLFLGFFYVFHRFLLGFPMFSTIFPYFASIFPRFSLKPLELPKFRPISAGHPLVRPAQNLALRQTEESCVLVALRRSGAMKRDRGDLMGCTLW